MCVGGSVKLTQKEVDEIRECMELLYSVQSIEYHNKNWLPFWATKSPKDLNREKLNLIERVLDVVGSSASQVHT